MYYILFNICSSFVNLHPDAVVNVNGHRNFFNLYTNNTHGDFFVIGVDRPHKEIIKEAIVSVRAHVGAVASFKEAVIVKKLPKTRSGKVARNTIAAMIADKPYKVGCSTPKGIGK